MSRPPPKIEQGIKAKRSKPWYQVLPLEEDGIQYVISTERSESAIGNPKWSDMYVNAIQADGSVKWKTQYFSQKYIPFLETDVQEIYPVDFLIDGEMIIIKHEYYDEHQGIFILDKETGKCIK